MTRDDLIKRYPRASADFVRRNASDWADIPHDDARPVAKLEPDSCDAPLDSKKVQSRAGPRFLVRVESFRKRLLDTDNLCAKYHCDLLRYSGIISGDSPGEAKIEVTQTKVVKGQPEKTVIEVFELTDP